MYKFLIALVMFNGCASTPKDRIAMDLPAHVKECMCEVLPAAQTPSYNISWKNKDQLKKQVRYCKCSLLISDFDDVEDPLDYIKPGTIFVQPTKLYPWDEGFNGPIKKTE